MVKIALLMLAMTMATQSCSREDSTSNLNSNYPPDYAWERSCHESAEFRVCQRTNGGDRAELAIEYKGMLVGTGKMSAYVKLNGRSGVFLMDIRGAKPRLLLANGPLDCHMSQSSNSWNCRLPEQNMLDMFYYATFNYNRFNAWDVEIAIVNEHGQWDSRFGANYKFRFEQ